MYKLLRSPSPSTIPQDYVGGSSWSNRREETRSPRRNKDESKRENVRESKRARGKEQQRGEEEKDRVTETELTVTDRRAETPSLSRRFADSQHTNSLLCLPLQVDVRAVT